MQNVILHIDGMSCGGCVKSVTRALLAVSGVVKAHVDLAHAQAQVEFDEAKTSPTALVEAVEDAGYDVKIDQ